MGSVQGHVMLQTVEGVKAGNVQGGCRDAMRLILWRIA